MLWRIQGGSGGSLAGQGFYEDRASSAGAATGSPHPWQLSISLWPALNRLLYVDDLSPPSFVVTFNRNVWHLGKMGLVLVVLWRGGGGHGRWNWYEFQKEIPLLAFIGCCPGRAGRAEVEVVNARARPTSTWQTLVYPQSLLPANSSMLGRAYDYNVRIVPFPSYRMPDPDKKDGVQFDFCVAKKIIKGKKKLGNKKMAFQFGIGENCWNVILTYMHTF